MKGRSSVRPILAAGLALLLLSLGGCAPATSDSQTIVFARAGGEYGDETIFVADADGSNERQLSPNGGACCAHVSPDGTTVLLLSNDDTDIPLGSSTVPLEGGEFVPLNAPDETLNLVGQAWSPDGTRIASEGWDDTDPQRTGVFTVSYPEGDDLLQLSVSDTGGHDVPSDYSPDGSEIVFFRSPAGSAWDIGGSLWIAKTDGSGVRPLDTGDVAPSWWARWSPDGTKILFATGRAQGIGAIWVIDPAGGGPTELYRADGSEFPITPVWSPDGSQIMFALDPHDDQFAHPANKIVVMNADGTDPRTVIDDSTFKRHLDWIAH